MPVNVQFARCKFVAEHRHKREGFPFLACESCPLKDMEIRGSQGWDLRIENNGVLRVQHEDQPDRYIGYVLGPRNRNGQ